ncbi:Aldo/keto reductase [Poronia punctata]|nr:Aldo/keto reductase [Poronia punctata]
MSETSVHPIRPDRVVIGGTTSIPRMISGLWQLAGGHDKHVDIDTAARAMKPLVDVGLDCFDMADHYGDAELVIGRYRASSSQNVMAFTKWCPPEDGEKSFEAAERAIDRALQRMGQGEITLMQYHVWDYTDDTYWHNLDHLRAIQEAGKIKHIGLTNVDAGHLELLIESGFTIATNQVSFSVLDQRLVQGRLASVCEKYKVGVLAYGTLLGGFLSEKWLGQAEPEDMESLNWSLRKYLRFIRAAGGWTPFQNILQALSTIATRHDVSIAAVATRYVLDVPVVSAVIVGCRLSSESTRYAARNLEAFSFTLSEDDHALIREAQKGLSAIPGDCGDEYRRSPFLTAAGNLSHHLPPSRNERLEEAIQRGNRIEYSTGSPWEPIAGYSRAVRTGNYIYVSGTTAHVPVGLEERIFCVYSARAQTVAVLDIVGRALKALGGSLANVVRTRVIIKREEDCEQVSRVLGQAFHYEGIRPANTVFVAKMVGAGFLVEIEAEARLGLDGVLQLSSH